MKAHYQRRQFRQFRTAPCKASKLPGGMFACRAAFQPASIFAPDIRASCTRCANRPHLMGAKEQRAVSLLLGTPARQLSAVGALGAHIELTQSQFNSANFASLRTECRMKNAECRTQNAANFAYFVYFVSQ